MHEGGRLYLSRLIGMLKYCCVACAVSGAAIIMTYAGTLCLTGCGTQDVPEFEPQVYTYVCDVGKRESVYSTAEKVQREVGHIDLLINNAGVVSGHHLLECPDELIERTLMVNCHAHFWVSLVSICKREQMSMSSVIQNFINTVIQQSLQVHEETKNNGCILFMHIYIRSSVTNLKYAYRHCVCLHWVTLEPYCSNLGWLWGTLSCDVCVLIRPHHQ